MKISRFEFKDLGNVEEAEELAEPQAEVEDSSEDESSTEPSSYEEGDSKTEPEKEQEVGPDWTKFSPEELTQLKEQMYEQGKKDAIEAQNREYKQIEEDTLLVVKGMREQFASLERVTNDTYQEIIRDCAKLSLKIAEKVIEDCAEKYSPEIVTSFLKKNLPLLNGKYSINVHVHPDVLKKVKELFPETQGDANILFKEDKNLQRQDCLLLWDKGSIAKDSQELIAKVNTIIEDYVPS